MQIYTIRLKEGDELRSSLMNFAKENNLTAASILTCVGAVTKARLRMAGAQPDKQDIRDYEDSFEIISLTGTFGLDDGHFHIALSDKDGKMIGGHLKSAVIDITADIVILNDETLRYTTELDETGFTCLVVKKNV